MTVWFAEHAVRTCITGYGIVACKIVTSVLPDCSIIGRVAAVLHGKTAAFDGKCNLAANSLVLAAVLSHHSCIALKDNFK